ncbi:MULTISPECIES: cytochrome-c oxidase, cbb3-type subunit II [Hydrocarboniphaga]|jgi:cytochrome c oxidase cbb3-type subunit 2|uniref:Cytochrome c oxidase, cbb3-type, subunit II n=1 Tax=Hydrocarboniphaga effusa AP103 TaxID=1172194 RepID=I8TBP5_9GAMM|nr:MULTISPECIES: cytochrome-c oxidase, cbb3-type subunit II [Hydrocarboniphaga]EIT70958.1 cytochrome c oxidase, cbb3-type, subunit II [Hydrocarboniphaga effusa AP103]MDZ4079026.1 cytochrome-c oxidase, cbb3-type subunit II [Hydrocarboniphaga sp.]
MSQAHEKVERNIGLMAVLIAAVISVGGFVEIVPMMVNVQMEKPAEGVKPLTALQAAGREVYLREGCYGCHSQQVRSLYEETLRYGPYSTAGESVYEHPFQWGSKRTGPDLSRVGGRYSDQWHRLHLRNPRDVVPESNMPGYPWLAEQSFTGEQVQAMMTALRRVGVPYREQDIADAPAAIKGKTKLDALIAYLQSLKASPRAAPSETPVAAAQSTETHTAEAAP